MPVYFVWSHEFSKFFIDLKRVVWDTWYVYYIGECCTGYLLWRVDKIQEKIENAKQNDVVRYFTVVATVIN